MSHISKILIALSFIVYSFQMRCDIVVCRDLTLEKCAQYYMCGIYEWEGKFCSDNEELYDFCCDSGAEDKPCAKLGEDGNPMCEEADKDNLCPKQKLSLLE
jgi:hypothetical protein